MDLLQRLIYDLSRLPYHYNIVELYTLFFEQVLPILSTGVIALGLLVAGYVARDRAGGPQRGIRRVALAGWLSAVGMAIYVVTPLLLDAQGVTPVVGHVRFYGLFFLPVGAIAGVLAVIVGSSSRLAPRDSSSPLARFSAAGYASGFTVLWLLFVLYTWLVLGETMNVTFALIRATTTAALGALLFAAAPYLVHVAELRTRRMLPVWGYGLLVAGTVALLVAQAATLVLHIGADVL